MAAGHISMNCSHMSRDGSKPVFAFCKNTVKANLLFLSLCPLVTPVETHSKSCSHVSLAHTAMLTTPLSVPQVVRHPFRWQTKTFSSHCLSSTDDPAFSRGNIFQSHPSQREMNVRAKAPGASLLLLQHSTVQLPSKPQEIRGRYKERRREDGEKKGR